MNQFFHRKKYFIRNFPHGKLLSLLLILLLLAGCTSENSSDSKQLSFDVTDPSRILQGSFIFNAREFIYLMGQAAAEETGTSSAVPDLDKIEFETHEASYRISYSEAGQEEYSYFLFEQTDEPLDSLSYHCMIPSCQPEDYILTCAQIISVCTPSTSLDDALKIMNDAMEEATLGGLNFIINGVTYYMSFNVPDSTANGEDTEFIFTAVVIK